MESFNLYINLMKLQNVAYADINFSDTETKRCLCIPVEDNDLQVRPAEENKKERCFLSLACWRNRQPSKFGDTHTVRQDFTRDYYMRHSPEEMKDKPIIGGMRPMRGSIVPSDAKSE